MKIENTIQNPYYLFLLVLFNSAIVLNFDFVIWEHPLFLMAVFLMVFNLIDLKYWWTTPIIICIGFLQLAPKFPRMANHCNLLLFIEVVILGILAYKTTHTKWQLPKAFVSKMFQIVLFSLYFFAGFSKLNTDFFNPCVSCVNLFNERWLFNFTGNLYPTPKVLSTVLQYATLILELIVPFGIFWKRTRIITALILLSFHFYLSFITFFHFSALTTFLILGALGSDAFKTKEVSRGLKIYIVFNLLVIGVNSYVKYQSWDTGLAYFLVGIVYNIGLLFLLIPFFRNYSTENKDRISIKHLSIVALTGLILMLWHFKSYIGLGNSGNLTMFSNLITETSQNNHLLIDTQKTKIFNWEEDQVEIIKLHDSLKAYELEGYKVPLIEFKYLTHLWGKHTDIPITATVVHQSDTLVIKDLKKSQFNQPKWWYKYVPFRKVKPNEPSPCLW